MSLDPRLTKLFGAAARVCLLHDHELGEPGRADAIEILRETVNSMSPLTAERAAGEVLVPVELAKQTVKLLDEVRIAHRTDDDLAFNDCDVDECEWCRQATQFTDHVEGAATTSAGSDAIDAARKPCTFDEMKALAAKADIYYDNNGLDCWNTKPERLMRLIDAARTEQPK